MAATDRYASGDHGINAPAAGASEVTPNDSTDLTNASRGVYVGTGGDMKVDLANGDTVTFKNILSSSFLDIRVTRVYATGTTASDIVVVY